jgi:hypothetical protein
MEKDQIVKFKEPADNDEATERFKVLEDRTERVLVEGMGFDEWQIKPTFVYNTNDLEVVK